jgi:hypothetical protein
VLLAQKYALALVLLLDSFLLLKAAFQEKCDLRCADMIFAIVLFFKINAKTPSVCLDEYASIRLIKFSSAFLFQQLG